MIQTGTKTFIPAELAPITNDGKVTSSKFVYDEVAQKTQEEVNEIVLGLASSFSDAEHELDKLGGQDISYNLLQSQPDAYIRNVQYENVDINTSYVEEYATDDVRNNRADQPYGVKSSDLMIYDNSSFSPKQLGLYHREDLAYNFVPNKRYFKVNQSTGVVNFNIIKTRRFIWADNIGNVRDLGGIPTENGGYIAYDKIFRGSEITGNEFHASSSAVTSLRNLSLSLELDLRNSDEVETNLTISNLYQRVPFFIFNKLAELSDERKNKIKAVFEYIANVVVAGGKVYFHGTEGSQRTGLVSAMIEGVLGVSQSEIDKDYELSSFSPFGLVRRNNESYKVGIQFVKEQYNNSWSNLLQDCGVSSELIENFKKVMIVDAGKEVQPSYYTVTYNELVNLKNKGYLVPGAQYRITDFDTYDFSTVPEYILTFKSAYHHFDLLLTAISNNELDSNAKALHSSRDTENYFEDVDLSKWEIKYDIENNSSKYNWAVDLNYISGYTDPEELSLSGVYDTNVYITFTYNDSPVTLYGIWGLQGGGGYSVEVAHDCTINGIELHEGDEVVINVNLTNEITNITRIVSSLSLSNLEIIPTVTRLDPTTVLPVYTHLIGKGVIYYMKDENNNELPYDFKNILFKDAEQWIPTFQEATNVVIKPWIVDGQQKLNKNIFLGEYLQDVYIDNNSHDNIFVDDCLYTTIGKSTSFIKLIDASYSQIGNNCTNIEVNNAQNVFIEDSCRALYIVKDNTNLYTKVPMFTTYREGKVIGTKVTIPETQDNSVFDERLNATITYLDGSEERLFGNGVLIPTQINNASQVESVVLEDSVIEIASQTFKPCTYLVSVVCTNHTPPIIGTQIFAPSVHVYVEDEYVDTYMTAWSEYSENIYPLTSTEGPNATPNPSSEPSPDPEEPTDDPTTENVPGLKSGNNGEEDSNDTFEEQLDTELNNNE